MNNYRFLSCALACAIHFSPAARLICHTSKLLKSNFAIISKWSAGLAAVMGSVNAVSGASTVITSPSSASGKVGESFSYRITTAPDQANLFRANPLPDGLALGTTRTTRSFIRGTPTTPGVYEVTIVASDDGRRDRTIEKILTINIQPNGIPPEIVEPPTSVVVDAGGTAVFTTEVSGTSPFTYQWMFNNAPIPGANHSELFLSNVSTSDSGNYHVLISNPGGRIESDVAQLLVHGPPHILDQPQSLRVPAGEFAKLEVHTMGPDPTTYQWFKNGVELTGETSQSISLPSVDEAVTGKYTVSVRNSYGEVTSEAAELKIDYGTTTKAITIASWSDAWKYHESGVTPSADWMDLEFDDSSWESGNGVFFVEDANLPVAKGRGLQLGQVTYYFRKTFMIDEAIDTATLSLSTLIDDGYVLYLNGALIHRLGMDTGPVVHDTLANRTVGNAVLEGPFSGNTSLLNNGENVLAVEVHQATSNSSDVVFGMLLEAELNIPNEHPIVVSMPKDQSVFEGDSIHLVVEANGTGPLSFQWLFNGDNLPGENGPRLSLSEVSVENEGDYRVVISNPFGSVTSPPIQVIVKSAQTQYQEMTQVRFERGAIHFNCELDQTRVVTVEYADHLLDSVWKELETKTLDQGSHRFSYTVESGGSTRFYRLKIVR